MPSPRGSDRGNFLTPSREISGGPPQSNRVRREASAGSDPAYLPEVGVRPAPRRGCARGQWSRLMAPQPFAAQEIGPHGRSGPLALIRSPRSILFKPFTGLSIRPRAVKTASGPIRQILSGRQTFARAGMNGQRGEASGGPLGGESLCTRDERPSTLRTCACYG